MYEPQNIILLDSNTRRRAVISHTLSAGNMHVEPFETLDELAASWPRSGYALVETTGGAIPDLITAMAQAGEWFPIIAFGSEVSPQMIVEAVVDGAVEFIGWPFTIEELQETLGRASQRIQTIGSLQMRQAVARRRIEKLTGREKEVLHGVASGLSNRLIAEHLSISPRTVEIHRSNMLNKLDASHSSQAIKLAIEAALVT